LGTLKEKLIKQGWKEMSLPDEDCKWSMYKSFKGWRDCTTNEKPPSVAIRYYELEMKENTYKSCEIEICGEINNSDWIIFKFYAIHPNWLEKRLSFYVDKLKKAWESLS